MAPRLAFDPPDAGDGLQYRPTLDDILLVVLAIATVLGALILIGLSSMSAVSRLEAAISRLAAAWHLRLPRPRIFYRMPCT